MNKTWLTSWPAIGVGFLLCFVPGLVLLWRRTGTSTGTKAAVSAAAIGLLVVVGAQSPDTRTPVSGPVVDRGSSAPSTTAPEPTWTPTPAPTPAPTRTAGATPTRSATAGSAEAAVLALTVKGRAPRTGYDRDQFGPAWVDVDRNGCDTRNDLLIAYLTHREMSGSCKVLAGDLADPYTGRSIRFVRGGASEVDIDHLVPLSDAWQKGAARWPYAKRVAFANDPVNLQPADASANRQKGDSDAASWLPPNRSFRCTYVARQAAVKRKYGVWVTAAERDAMLRVLGRCPGTRLPAPGDQPTIASNTGGPPPGATPAPVSGGGGTDPQFSTCGDANAAGYGPYYEATDPEYSWYQDRDHDGSVCE